MIARWVVVALVGCRAMLAHAFVAVPHDVCANARVIASLPFGETTNVKHAFPAADEVDPSGGGDPPERSVWYRYTAPADGAIEIDPSTGGDLQDPSLEVSEGTCDHRKELACTSTTT